MTQAPITEPTLEEMVRRLEAIREELPWKVGMDDCEEYVIETPGGFKISIDAWSITGTDLINMAAMAPGATAKAIRLERENAELKREIEWLRCGLTVIDGLDPEWQGIESLSFSAAKGLIIEMGRAARLALGTQPTLTEATPND